MAGPTFEIFTRLGVEGKVTAKEWTCIPDGRRAEELLDLIMSRWNLVSTRSTSTRQ